MDSGVCGVQLQMCLVTFLSDMETAVMTQLQTAVLEKSPSLYKVFVASPLLLYTLLLWWHLIWRCSDVYVCTVRFIIWRWTEVDVCAV